MSGSYLSKHGFLSPKTVTIAASFALSFVRVSAQKATQDSSNSVWVTLSLLATCVLVAGCALSKKTPADYLNKWCPIKWSATETEAAESQALLGSKSGKSEVPSYTV